MKDSPSASVPHQRPEQTLDGQKAAGEGAPPAGREPRPPQAGPGSPVLARLVLEDLVAVGHHALGEGIHLQAWVHPGQLQQRAVRAAAQRPVHVPALAPHHIERVSSVLEVVRVVAQQQGHARVRDHAQGAAPAHVRLEAHGGRLVHAQYALGAVDLGAQARAQHLAGAGHHGAAAARFSDQRLRGEAEAKRKA